MPLKGGKQPHLLVSVLHTREVAGPGPPGHTIEAILLMSNIIAEKKLRECIVISGFVLIFIGTVGLLLNEFVWTSISSRTVIFAVANFVGLVILAITRFGMSKGKQVG